MNEDMRQWPRIYLTYCDGSDEHPALWCQDRVDDDDVEYVNVAAFDAQADRLDIHFAQMLATDAMLTKANKRITELEAAARAVIAGFPFKPDVIASCDCTECKVKSVLMALVSKEVHDDLEP